jgi:hypothetical protein
MHCIPRFSTPGFRHSAASAATATTAIVSAHPAPIISQMSSMHARQLQKPMRKYLRFSVIDFLSALRR